MRTGIAVLSLLTLAVPAAADDGAAIGGVGFAVGTQKSKFATDRVDMRFSNNYVSMDGYVAGGPVYLKMQYTFWGLLQTTGTVTSTDKETGVVTTDLSAKSVSGNFLAVLPKLEGGVALGGALRGTLGLYFSDSTQYPTNAGDSSWFYAFDLGVALGGAILVGETGKTVFALHPTLRFHASFYNQQTKFFDGGGGGLDVVAMATFGKIAIYARGGVEGHGLTGTHWPGSQGAEVLDADTATSYIHFGIGYSPLD